MAAIKDTENGWREKLRPARWRTAFFHVEVAGRMSGRRTVTHEYPKRDDPYSEDMGRMARRIAMTGYLIGSDPRFREIPLPVRRRLLIEALEQGGPGTLVHPAYGAMQMVCTGYRETISRQRGGYCEFEMQFVEAGSPVMTSATTGESPAAAVDNAASMVETTAQQYMETGSATSAGFE